MAPHACSAKLRAGAKREVVMAYDASSGRDPRGGWCLACRRPLEDGQPVTRISFQTDPEGKEGLSGLYHKLCAKPFSELAKVINLNPWARF
jgi:hypothetical protein